MSNDIDLQIFLVTPKTLLNKIYWGEKKTYCQRLLVPGLTPKLRSCHSILTTSKAEQTEKSTALLRPLREVKSRSELLSPKLERQTDKRSEPQLNGAEPSMGSSPVYLNCN